MALEAGDRSRFTELAGFVREHGGQSRRRRLKTAIAGARGTGGVLFHVMSGVTRVTAGYKRMRRSRWRKLSWDEVLARYAGERTGTHEPAERVPA